jgi:hypothetical protein
VYPRGFVFNICLPHIDILTPSHAISHSRNRCWVTSPQVRKAICVPTAGSSQQAPQRHDAWAVVEGVRWVEAQCGASLSYEWRGDRLCMAASARCRGHGVRRRYGKGGF